MTAALVVRHDQDWFGFVVVIASVVLAVALDYTVTRLLLWRDSRANRAALAAARATVEPCPGCGCRVRAGHQVDDDECRALQAERQARAEVRTREWSA